MGMVMCNVHVVRMSKWHRVSCVAPNWIFAKLNARRKNNFDAGHLFRSDTGTAHLSNEIYSLKTTKQFCQNRIGLSQNAQRTPDDIQRFRQIQQIHEICEMTEQQTKLYHLFSHQFYRSQKRIFITESSMLGAFARFSCIRFSVSVSLGTR